MSAAIPYKPMHEPRKHVSEERMAEILSKRSGKAFALPPPSRRKTLVLKPKSNLAKEMEQEAWLIKRLGTHGAAVDAGLTDKDIRRERMREAISKVGPTVIVGRKKDGSPLTYEEAFQQLYGVSYAD